MASSFIPVSFSRALQYPIFPLLPSQSNPNPNPNPTNFRSSFTFRLQTKSGAKLRNAPSLLMLSCLRDSSNGAIVTKDTWEKSVLKSQIPVLVEFNTSWCGPCRIVDQVIKELALEYAGRIECYILNAESNPHISEDCGIKAVPAVLLFKNGEKCESVIGTMPKEFYVSAIEKILNS